MVTRFILAGTSPPTELTTNIEQIVYQFIHDNWAPIGGTPAVNSIKISDQWWDGFGEYQIHVRPIVTVVVKEAIGGTMKQYATTVGIHVFARRRSEWSTDTGIGNMMREIERIFAVSPTVMSPGIVYATLSDERDIPDEENFPDISHKMFTLRVIYSQAVISS